MAAMSSENSVADPDNRKTLLVHICVVPLVPLLPENWGYVPRLHNGAGVRDRIPWS